MMLSKHVSYSEMVKSGTPTAAQVENMRAVCAIADVVRDHFDAAFNVHSGWRSPESNAAAHGATHSEHLDGCAVDFDVAGYSCETVLAYLAAEVKAGRLVVDQVIGETRAGHGPFTWVHVGFRPAGPNRGQLLQSFDGKHYAALALAVA